MDGEYYQAAARALPGQSSPTSRSRALVHEVLDKGMAALVFDAATDQRFAASESIMMSGIRSMVAAPLLAEQEADRNDRPQLEGGGQAVRRAGHGAAGVARRGGLAQAEEHRAALERDARWRQLEAELALARHIQVSLLPETLPTFAGWSILGRNIPS